MKTCRCLILTAVFLLLLLFQTAAAAVDGAPGAAAESDVQFRWAFAAMTNQDGKSIRPITQDIALQSGDQLKMMVELQLRCFVYIFHYNPQDGLKLVFPYALQQFGTDYQPKRKYYIPRGEAWFKLDGTPGKEVFYLIASAKRLDSLEQAYQRHESAAAPQKAEAARAVLDQIRALRKEHIELGAPAERPVPIGGAVRGVEKVEDPSQFDVSALAKDIISTDFMARTFTIEHK